AGGADQPGVAPHHLHSFEEEVLAVRVLLAEVARTRADRLHRVVTGDPGPQEVLDRVVPGVEAGADVELDPLVLGVEPVLTELGGSALELRRDGRRFEQRVELDQRRHRELGFPTFATFATFATGVVDSTKSTSRSANRS